MASVKSKLKSVLSSAKEKITNTVKSVAGSLSAASVSSAPSLNRKTNSGKIEMPTFAPGPRSTIPNPGSQTLEETVNNFKSTGGKGPVPNQSYAPANQSKIPSPSSTQIFTDPVTGETSYGKVGQKNLPPGAVAKAIQDATKGSVGGQSKIPPKNLPAGAVEKALEDAGVVPGTEDNMSLRTQASSASTSSGSGSAGGTGTTNNSVSSASGSSGGGAGGGSSVADQLNKAKEEADKLQSQVENLYNKDQTVATDAVSSDESVVRDEQDALSELRTTDLSPTRNAIKLLNDEIARNEEQLANELASIQGTFDAQKTSDISSQTGEAGQLSMGIANAGGFLGFSGSGAGVMLKLAESHRAELNSLEAQRVKALTEAKAAAANRRFDIVQMKAKEIARIDQETYERTEEYNGRVRKNAEASAATAQTQKDQTDIYNAIKSGAKTPLDIFAKLGGAVDVDTIASTLENFGAGGAGAFKLSATQTAGLIGAGMGMDDIAAFNEYVSENGYDAKIKASLSPAQRAAANEIFSTGAVGSGSSSDFTDQEKRKLEQAGLLNGPRQTQLDFLYAEKGDGEAPYKSIYTGQILDGKTSISSLPINQQKEAREELYALGFASDAVPDFYRDNLETKMQATPTSQYLKDSWRVFRKTALGESLTSE